MDATAPLDRVRAIVMADPGLQQRLSIIQEPDLFVAAIIQIAATAGIVLENETILVAMESDPLGIDRFMRPELTARGVPGQQWLPSAVMPAVSEMAVEWLHFGDVPLTAPFFEDTLRRVRLQPFNRMFRQRTPLADLPAVAAQEDVAIPDGFIFHLSRCGSTLVSQMLASLPGTIVVSEAPPLDSIVHLVNAHPGVPLADRAHLLRAIVGALGRDRTGDRRHYVVKLDSWHALALPLFRAAFPDTPWIFLYREPVEILVSQMRMPGIQAVPGVMPVDVYGIADGDKISSEEYCARVFERTCSAILDHAGLGGGRLINYASLPGAVEDEILSHFGIETDAAGREAMAAASGRDAKAPSVPFIGDTEVKQKEATEAVRAAAAAHLAEPYLRLEAMRLLQEK